MEKPNIVCAKYIMVVIKNYNTLTDDTLKGLYWIPGNKVPAQIISVENFESHRYLRTLLDNGQQSPSTDQFCGKFPVPPLSVCIPTDGRTISNPCLLPLPIELGDHWSWLLPKTALLEPDIALHPYTGSSTSLLLSCPSFVKLIVKPDCVHIPPNTRIWTGAPCATCNLVHMERNSTWCT